MTTSLLDLAQQFDETAAADIEGRIALGEQMKVLLGARAEDFDARFTDLVTRKPAFLTPAVTTLFGMGFAETGAAPQPVPTPAVAAPAADTPPPSLLDLARQYDRTEQPIARSALAKKLKALLGGRFGEYESRYQIQGNISATAILCEMGLVVFAAEPMSDAIRTVEGYLQGEHGERPDWISAVRILQEGLLGALRLAPLPEPDAAA